MAQAPDQGQPGQPGQPTQQQILQARLDNPLVSQDFRGEIRDINDYLSLSAALATQRKRGHEVAPLSQDANKNFPHNDPVKQKQLAGRLFVALRNQVDILDGTVKKDENNQVIRDANGEPVKKENSIIRRMREETDINLEMLAWGLMLSIRDAQLGDLYALRWARNFHYQHFDSFLDRFNAVLESIKVSKKAASDLMEASWSCRLANGPNHEVQRKNRNKSGNKNKQTLLEEAAAKRKREREEQEQEEQEGQEDDEDHHVAASPGPSSTPATAATAATPATPAAPASRPTRKTPASRTPRKQHKRSTSDTPRRAAPSTQPAAAAAQPLGQPFMRAAANGLTQEPETVPQMTASSLQPATLAGQRPEGPEASHAADQFFGPTNGWVHPAGAAAYPWAQPQTTSVSFQGSPPDFVLGQPGYHQQQPFAHYAAGQAVNLTAPTAGNTLPPAYVGNNNNYYYTNNHSLPQANDFGAQSIPETASSPAIVPSQGTAPADTYMSLTTPSYPQDAPLSRAPETPWSSLSSELTSPRHLGPEPENEHSDIPWDAYISFGQDENPEADFFM